MKDGRAPKAPPLYDVQQWEYKRHVATIAYQVPFTMARAICRRESIKTNLPRGTYFKPTRNQKAYESICN